MIRLIGSILLFFINIYLMVLFIRILLSWISLPYNNFTKYISMLTDPVLDFFRKHLPVNIGFINISSIFPFLILIILSNIINYTMIRGEQLTINFFLLTSIDLINSITGIVIFAFIIMAVVSFFVDYSSPYSSLPFISVVKKILKPLLTIIHNLLKIKHHKNEKIYLIILIVLLIITGIIIDKSLDLLKVFIYSINNKSIKIIE